MDMTSKILKAIAGELQKTFGGKTDVKRFSDDNHDSFVDIMSCADSPQTGVTSYATIGLSEHPLMDNGEEFPARLELIGACGSDFKYFANALATAAFCIINSKWFCHPDAIFPDIFSMYNKSSTMKHMMFIPPFLWDDSPNTLELPERTIAWLQAIPISEGEYRLAEKEGPERLGDLFEKYQIDVYDLERPSIV
jgi:antitoxin YqcF